jgi:hypothetical protein
MSDPSNTGAGGNYAPMPSEPSRAPATVGDAPSSVRNAVTLMYVRAALGVVGIIVVLATKDTLKKDLLKKNPTADAAKLDSLFNTAITAGIVGAVVFLVLYVLLAMQVAKGKQWARIVTLILAGLGVLSMLVSFASTVPTLSHVVSIIAGLIDLAIFVLLLTGGSGAYFRRAV